MDIPVTIRLTREQYDFVLRGAKSMQAKNLSNTVQDVLLKLMEIGYDNFVFEYPEVKGHIKNNLRIVKDN